MEPRRPRPKGQGALYARGLPALGRNDVRRASCRIKRNAIGTLSEIFAYASGKPLLFTHEFFWAFFLLVILAYALVYKRVALRTLYLLAVSLFFYFKTSGVFIILLLFTICSDYFWGHRIAGTSGRGWKRLYVTLSVCLNLFLLCYFKYAYFFHESFRQIAGTEHQFFNHFAAFSNRWFDTGFSVDKLILPVGISFFTFQSISYTVDIYRGKIVPLHSLRDYGFFVSFFPHLVAGPIVKAHDFVHQINMPYQLSRFEFGTAMFWIVNGFCKKIIADYLAVNFIDRIFDNPALYSGVEVALGILGYSLQIYMDFSGYTDMAIGLALLFGFRLKANFNSPYKAASTSEFWKRWHISLSSWLQEYLYIPLGGSRRGTVGSYLCITLIVLFLVMLSGKLWVLGLSMAVAGIAGLVAWISPSAARWVSTNVNLMVTMLLGGLWHGSSWLFIIWGGLNGLGIVAHKLWCRISPFSGLTGWRAFPLMLGTLAFISFTRIFFRSTSLGVVNALLDRLWNFGNWHMLGKVLYGYWPVFSLMAAGYAIHWIPSAWKASYRSWFASRSYVFMGVMVVIAVLLMFQLMSGEMQPFIYFQF